MNIQNILNFPKGYELIKGHKLPIQVAYRLSKLMKKCEEDMQFYRRRMTEIIQEYGQRDEDGNYVYDKDGVSILIQDDKKQACRQEMLELENLDCDGYNNVLIPISALIDMEFTPEELEPLVPFLEE